MSRVDELAEKYWMNEASTDCTFAELTMNAFKAGYAAKESEASEISFDEKAFNEWLWSQPGPTISAQEAARWQFERDKAVVESMKWLARNPSAFPSAWDYAQHLESKLAEAEAKLKSTEHYRTRIEWLETKLDRAREALRMKCMCYDANDPRADRNPCHACKVLKEIT